MVEELVSSLRKRGVELWLEDDRVRYKAAAEVLTPDLLAELKQHKAAIAEMLRQAPPKPSAPAATGERPLSFSQERLWFLDMLEPESPAYNIPLAIRLRGTLNVPALLRSFAEIVRRHEVLRTMYETREGKPVLRILPTVEWELPVQELAALPVAERDAELARRIVADAQQPFRLSCDLKLRTRLYRLEPTEHVLTVMLHHIASDGWSLEVLFRELTALYEAYSQDRPSTLPELPIQFVDHAAWQRDWLSGPELQRQLTYWTKQLANAPALLELPTDHPRPPVQTLDGRTLTEVFPVALLNGLQELSRREGVSLFMTLLAAYQVLLARYARQEDILVGTPMACRNRTEVEGLIGFFVNTVVLRGNLHGNPPFRTLLGQAREATLEALSHQELPFEKLVEELHPQRNLAYAPLFQVMFIANGGKQTPDELRGLTVSHVLLTTLTAKFDLTLYWEILPDGLQIQFEYNSNLFEATTIQRMFGHYRTLLEGIVAKPEQPIAELPMLAAAERAQLIRDWNATQQEYPRQASLPELIEAQVQRTPDSIAAVFGAERVTYRELNERGDRLAAHLRSLGVAPGKLAGIYVERSLDMLIGLLGILKAGGAYLPLDPSFPAERLAFMIEDAQPVVLLTQQKLSEVLPPHQCPVACIDAVPVAAVPEFKREFGELAYVLYTSGSTGKPKGVQLPQAAVVNFLLSMQREPGLKPDDVLVAVTTLSFDIAGLELWLPLVTGARVVIASKEVAADGAQLAKLLAESRATLLQATPVTWRLLLAAGWKGDSRLKILVGGEALPVDLAERLVKCGGEVWNMYGPTETTIWSAASRVLPGEPIVVGRPIANTQFYVVDALMQSVPVGVPGELLIGGDGLARGYLNRPELTVEKFIASPFVPGARVYRTGDLVRYRMDGTLEFLGRIDHQVKVRGFRIELGEIETALGQHPQVAQAVVIAREDTPGEKRLAAYVTLKNGKDVPAVEFRSFLKERLPDYMTPAVFVRLPALPLTPNGKVDRKALPKPEAGPADGGAGFIAARDELEKKLVKAWEEIFGRSGIGVRDNFFDLGGHSLLAVKLFARVEKLTGKNLPLVTLFQAPTIEQLAGVLRQDGWEAPWSCLVPIKETGTRPPFYCVHGVGGNILEYLDLAKYVEADQPFYGIQAVGLDGKQAWLKTVPEMAERYVKEIREFQPVGPYYIGGSSYGGVVAYEMAQQLVAAGETVALLALFDTGGPGYPEQLPATSKWQKEWSHLKYRVSLHWGNFRAATPQQKWEYFCSKVSRAAYRVGWYAKRWTRKAKARLEELAMPKAIVQTRKSTEDAVSKYVFQPYPGRAVLFRALQQPPGIKPSRSLGWDTCVRGGLEIYDTPGHHGAIVREPRARKLAEQLQDCLRKAHAAAKETR